MAVKQVIVWNNALQCRLGKKMAQAGHAALGNLSRKIRDKVDDKGRVTIRLNEAELEWYRSNFRKIVLRVESEEELLTIFQKAKEAGIDAVLITDAGLTEFDGPTNTCVALGPDTDERIDAITGDSGPFGKLNTL
jgi:PTH2 family peptidyl-tRNA hydrolase